MLITPDTAVRDIATALPATIAVFQRHQIDFCCGGRVPLREACAARGLDTDDVLSDLRAPGPPPSDANWSEAPLTDLVAHIQHRFHLPLRAELPRLGAMVDKVVSRHGDHLPGVLLPLQHTFRQFAAELIDHMAKEDRVLFPLIEQLDAGQALPAGVSAAALLAPISAMETEHAAAGEALATMRRLTDGYAPPEWACPTFRGLYYGLAELEADMHLHVHLENNVLFPRAWSLAERGRS